jgi:hypothetical protein
MDYIIKSEIERPNSEFKTYLCAIILKGCLALSDQTERQAEIKPRPLAP